MLADLEYKKLCLKILEDGELKEDRTGVGTKSIFGYQMRFDLSKGFPLLTTKKINFNLVWSELLWFIKGDTNIKFLLENNNNIWNEWAFKNWIESEDYTGPDMTNFGHRVLNDEEFAKQYKEQMKIFKDKILSDDSFAKKYGDLGNVYGKQWRNFNEIDQLKTLIEQIKNNPSSRRLILSAWNPSEIDTMALPPCHTMFQFYVQDNKLSCQLYQRSGDVFLGIPFNIASYSLLTMLIAKECNLELGEFVHTLGDAHIYSNHFDQVKLQMEREPYNSPNININEFDNIFDLEISDVILENYESHPFIKAPIAV
ncbi:thymidylate synthase [Gemelliphila palaticanis]|uniref:Thymidylate synthase n=1 Tax=Gemelliphila palaticanis TaxID=81950 RepID=A0ABX2T255_9BACL|nr:thymidylate synthase [Gemella palaticanis]MBF0715614.1 thymidylate synthase [Gemella palaticanis]NYS47544.1 thymidylate synthase [Gemella palaticanis]